MRHTQKITSELANQIADNIKMGLNWSDSALLCGVSRNDFKQWMAQAESDPESVCGALRRYLRGVEEDAKRESLDRIKESAREGNGHSRRWLKKRGIAY